MTTFSYGNYKHAPSEVQLTVSKHAQFSARGNRQATTITFGLSGMLLSSDGTQATLISQMAALENAYSNDFQSCGLYLDTALTQPVHTINNALTISGVRVMSFEWAKGEGAELTAYRNYTATLQAIFPGTSGLLAFHESINVRGTGGPRIIVMESLRGDPQPQIVCLKTKVTATQRGTAIGLNGWVSIPDPLWPDAVKFDQWESSQETAIVMPSGQWQFPSSWSYTFESNEPLEGAQPHDGT